MVSVTRPFLSLRRVWLARLLYIMVLCHSLPPNHLSTTLTLLLTHFLSPTPTALFCWLFWRQSTTSWAQTPRSASLRWPSDRWGAQLSQSHTQSGPGEQQTEAKMQVRRWSLPLIKRLQVFTCKWYGVPCRSVSVLALLHLIRCSRVLSCGACAAHSGGQIVECRTVETVTSPPLARARARWANVAMTCWCPRCVCPRVCWLSAMSNCLRLDPVTSLRLFCRKI